MIGGPSSAALRAFACFCLLAGISTTNAERRNKGYKKLKSQKAEVRVEAALSLSEEPTERSLLALATVCTKDKSPAVRKAALQGLADIAQGNSKFTEEATGYIKVAAKRDRKKSVRSLASKLLKDSKPRIKIIVPADKTGRMKRAGLVKMANTIKATLSKGVKKSGKRKSANSQKQKFILRSYVTALSASKTGEYLSVQCSVSLRIAPRGSNAKGASEKLGAEKSAVATGSGVIPDVVPGKGQAAAASECVSRVAEAVISDKIVSYMKRFD